MSTLFDIYNDPQLQALSQQIDNAVKSIPIKDVGNNTAESASSNLISQFLSSEDPLTSESSLKNNPFASIIDKNNKNGISEVSTLLDKLSIAPEREQRYKVYDELYNSCPMIKKIVSVWINNLFQKNPVTGKSILIKEKADNTETDASQLDENYENRKKMSEIFIDEIIRYYDLIDKLKNKIVPYQLMYGDAFVEIINLDNYDPTKSTDSELFLSESVINNTKKEKRKKIISESEILESIKSQINKKENLSVSEIDNIIDEMADIFIDDSDDDIFEGENIISTEFAPKKYMVLKEKTESEKLTSNFESFYTYYENKVGDKLQPYLKTKISKNTNHTLNEENSNFQNEFKKFYNTKIDLSNIMMLVHHPKNIVILATQYGSKIGYVEINDKEQIQTTNIGQQLSSIVGRLVTVGGKSIDSTEEIISKLIKTIIKKIILKSSKTKTDSLDKALKHLDPEVLNTIKKLLIETYKDENKSKATTCKKIRARFIPIDRMFHFTVKASDYAPYGSSIIDPLVLQGKLYMLSQLSNIIMKLSRAVPMRKWILDVGPLQDQARYVQQIKRELYNQKVTLSDIMSFKSAPKLLSDFKDMFTFRKNGVSHLDMELQQLGDAIFYCRI